jgi:hypothetical protein
MTAIDLDSPAVTAAAPRRRRPGAAATGAVVLFLLLGDAPAPPQRPWDRPVILDDVPVGAMAVADDTVYLARPGGAVTAHTADGRQRWSSAVGDADTLLADAVGDLVLLRGVVRRPGSVDVYTVMVETATGVPRWRRDGFVRLIDRAAGLIVFTDLPSASGESSDVRSAFSYRLLELATGREVWPWGAHPEGTTLTPVSGLDRALAGLLLRDAAGHTVLQEVATGRTRPLPDLPDTSEAYGTNDGLLLRAETDLVMYDWITMQQRWRVPGPASRLVSRCGPWLCVDHAGGTAAIDPVNGSIRWQHPGMLPAETLGQALVLHADGGFIRSVKLVDPATGQTLLELAGWNGLQGPPASSQVATRSRPDGRTQIVMVNMMSLQVHLIAETVVAADSCLSSSQLLICRSSPLQLTLWRLM